MAIVSAISNYRSLSQSPKHTFVQIAVMENPKFAVGISILTVVVPEIKIFPVFGYHITISGIDRSISSLRTVS